jgi:hypothetical protein
LRAVQKYQLVNESCSIRSAPILRAVQKDQLMNESCSIRSVPILRAVQKDQLLTKELFKKISSYEKSCSNRSAQIGEFFQQLFR